MKLPDDFSFSQSTLQDFMDCEYRFFLRYIRKIEWPAVESEPVLLNQEKMRIGQIFHRLVQQYFSGIDPSILVESIDDPVVDTWWQNFLNLDLIGLQGTKSAEQSLSIPFSEFRLSAKYDLIHVDPSGMTTIYDWKTSLVPPKASILRSRAQSRVYPLILHEINTRRFGNDRDLTPSVEMVYWFPAFPDDSAHFAYDNQQYLEDQDFLQGLIRTIIEKDEQQFYQVEDSRKCIYCRYRSLCARGTIAGNVTELDQEIFEEDIFGLSPE